MLALERLANCKVRVADQLMATDAAAAKTLLDEAQATLEHLLGLGWTAERWSLMGGLHKRRFRLARAHSAVRAEALREMSKAYERAYELARASSNGDLVYPLGNQVAAELVLSWRSRNGKRPSKALRDQLGRLREAARAAASFRTDTFSLVAAAEHMLLEALAARALNDAAVAAILNRLNEALSRGATRREVSSIRTQLTFFRTAAETELPRERRAQVIERLDALGAALP
jgi:hypothetical protein